jgi:hypothetical protein
MLEVIKNYFIETLDEKRKEIIPESPPEYLNIISDAVHTSLNVISLSDAMYHDVEHTCLVTLCGQDIFCGKKIIEGNLNASDWLHYTISLLFHDIGYVKNLLSTDDNTSQTINRQGDVYNLEIGQTDASLTPYHIDRGKMYIDERNWSNCIDKNKLIDLISFTQFPTPERPPPIDENEEKFRSLAELVGSADLIGQLADPMYDEKIPRLFYEFQESGTANKMGYRTPQNLRESFPGFYLNFVRPNISEALKYLQVTEKGREWVAGLNYHVFSQSHKATIEKSGISLITELSELNLKLIKIDNFLNIVLEKVCHYTDWPIGHAYKLNNNKKESVLKSTGNWYCDIENDDLDEFIKISERYQFKSGEGLPGRVYESGSVQTIFDVTKDDNFPRAKLAKNIGVRGAFSFPIKDGDKITFVLEFFSLHPEQLDPTVLELMRHVSNQVSRNFYEHD